MKTVKNIILWVLSVFLLLIAIVFFTERFVSGFLMLLAALLCNPLVLSLIAKSGKRLKKRISIPGVIILFFAAALSLPASNDVQTEPMAAEAEEEEQAAQITSADDRSGAENTDLNDSEEEASGDSEAEEAESLANGETAASGQDEDALEESELTIHFLDVGQGDATLIACDGEYMLIDAGDNDKGTAVQNYLTKQGVTTLKYVVGTHPDEDHIGGLDVILYKFECETVMMPDVTNNTAAYRDVIDTMDTKGYQNTLPEIGDSYSLGSAEFTVLGPVKNYGDTNNSSIVLLLTHGENRFLFMGDAEEEAETDILNGDIKVDADVLKVGHHGSSTASSKSFIQAVSPEYAVISCAENNSYGHPHAETLNALRFLGVQVFRTDEQGTIVVTSDGQEMKWNCAPSETWKSGENTLSAAGSDASAEKTNTDAEQAGSQDNGAAAVQSAENREQVTNAGTGNGGNLETGEAPAGANYIGNKRNGKLHRATCHTLPKAENQAIFSTREEAVAAGYDDPCGNCNP